MKIRVCSKFLSPARHRARCPSRKPDLLKLSTGWMAKPCTVAAYVMRSHFSMAAFWADWRTTHRTTLSLIADQTVPLWVKQRTTRGRFLGELLSSSDGK
jgi:hypothetical protein